MVEQSVQQPCFEFRRFGSLFAGYFSTTIMQDAFRQLIQV